MHKSPSPFGWGCSSCFTLSAGLRAALCLVEKWEAVCPGSRRSACMFHSEPWLLLAATSASLNAIDCLMQVKARSDGVIVNPAALFSLERHSLVFFDSLSPNRPFTEAIGYRHVFTFRVKTCCKWGCCFVIAVMSVVQDGEYLSIKALKKSKAHNSSQLRSCKSRVVQRAKQGP